MLPCLICLSIICMQQRSRNACSTRPLRGAFSLIISEEGGVVTQEANMDQSTAVAPSMKPAAESTSTLLVLGAGPKAVSIAAKRHMLAKLGYPVPHLHIIDRQGVASHWSGHAGLTDGNQLLGTRPEKDIGFPYLSACWGDKALSRAVAKEVVHISWQSYLIDQLRYADWIDRGRMRPTHGEWSKYIQWVAERVEFDLCVAEVTKIATTADQKRWQLTCQPSEGGTPVILTGEGMVSGLPGPVITTPR